LLSSTGSSMMTFKLPVTPSTHHYQRSLYRGRSLNGIRMMQAKRRLTFPESTNVFGEGGAVGEGEGFGSPEPRAVGDHVNFGFCIPVYLLRFDF
jgi:hypothetical protein